MENEQKRRKGSGTEYIYIQRIILKENQYKIT